MKKLGRYEILGEVGRGAMGRVYRARDPEIDRVVAIKTITMVEDDSVAGDEFRQRFLREAKAAGRLLHPGIVTIFDVGEDTESGTPFIVMEYIEGRSLQEVGQDRQLPKNQALELVKQLAEALDYAHREGIVHRDVKPANIIVTGEGRAKIADFGVAKLQTIELTQSGMMMGTPTYMSPEQLLGERIDGRSDLFSLTTILYWLLTGQRPFSGSTMASLSFNVVYKEPPPPSSFDASLGSSIDEVIHLGLAKDAADRYQTGRELADDLDDAIHGRPLRSQAKAPAKPAPKPIAAGPKPAWTQPAVLGAAALVVVILIAGVVTLQRWPSPETTNGALSSPPADSVPEGVAQEQEPASEAVATSTPQRRAPASSPPQPRPVAQTRLQVRGGHGFERAELSLYADGSLLKRMPLESAAGTATFTTEAIVSPGLRVISVTVREEGSDRTERGYIEGDFTQGQSRTLEISFATDAAGRRRGKMDLRWSD